MKLISYGWTVLINIITIAVVISIFDAIYGTFETIVCSLLVLIYVNLSSFGAIYGQSTTKRILMDHARFKRLRTLLKEEPDPNEVAFEADDEESVKVEAKKSEIKFYINTVFNFLIYIIAIVNIFDSI